MTEQKGSVITVKFDEFMKMPKDMPLDEWQKIVARKEKLEKKAGKLQTQCCDCEDALSVLEDEKGSERWNKWENKLKDAYKRYNKALNELAEIKERYNL